MNNIQLTQLQLCKKVLDNLSDAVFFVDNQLRILYWNKMAEQLTGYTVAEVLGRSCWNNLIKHVDVKGNAMCANVCPLAKAIAEGSSTQDISCALQHKEGRRINVIMRNMPIKDDNENIVGAVQFFSESAEKSESEKKELTRMDFVDQLTNLPNRKFGELRIAALVHEINRGGLDCGIMLINLDSLKELRSELGSEVCDKIIKISAKLIASNIGPADSISRWSEDCFLVIADNTKKGLLLLSANKLQALLSKTIQIEDFSINMQVTISATLPRSSDNLEMIYKRLNRQLQRGKDLAQAPVLIDTPDIG